MSGPVLGNVVALWRFPVKSMGGEGCAALDFDARGVVGDRAFAVRDAGGKLGSGKTTRRFRRIDGLLELAASEVDGVPQIRLPDGRILGGACDATHEALSSTLGQPVALVPEAAVSHFDAGAVHVLDVASLLWLGERLPASAIDVRRFRPNLLIDGAGDRRLGPDQTGRLLELGDTVTLRVVGATERCRMVGLRQGELPEDPDVMRVLARDSRAELGVYAEVVRPGRVRVGDPVRMT